MSQLRAHHALLAEGVFGNPHSEAAPSRASVALVEAARRRVLAHLGVDDATHDVVFTANATAAIKLVAEAFRFGAHAPLVLAADNHNSVNGVRAYARRAGAAVHVLPLDASLRLDRPAERLGGGGGLLAFPAQSNFSGVRHPLALVDAARARGLTVLLDAAAYVPSATLDLGACPADFVALSFYKMFGYPTGVGALVARRDALARLDRPWFAGGTVAYASVAAGLHRLHDGHDGFEDGTPDFLSIAALAAGFDLLDEVGPARLAAHVAALTRRLLDGLRSLAPCVRVYGPDDAAADRGGTVAFDVLAVDGAIVPYEAVEARAHAAGVAIRGGCFCNPGAAEAAFGLDGARVRAALARQDERFDRARLAADLGRPLGAVRASLGLASNERDVDRLLAVVRSLATSRSACSP